MTTELEHQVRWLMDRAAISELLHGFARALDTCDYQAYADNDADGGSIELPDPMRPGNKIVLEKPRMLDLVPRSRGRYAATHHISTNHEINIQGDTATSRSYLQAVHVNGDLADHWSIGGWYDCDYVRTAAGWKFNRVCLTPVWRSGTPGEIKPDQRNSPQAPLPMRIGVEGVSAAGAAARAGPAVVPPMGGQQRRLIVVVDCAVHRTAAACSGALLTAGPVVAASR